MSEQTPARIRQVIARDEIRQLPYRYAAAIEKRDVNAMVELFVPHARFGAYGEGPDALRRLMTQSIEQSVFAVILVANHLIDIDSDSRASGEVWAHCFAQTEREGFVEQLIKYEDRYELYESRWLFRHRRHRLWFGVANSVSPLQQSAAHWPVRQVGVGDVPLADPVFESWWRR